MSDGVFGRNVPHLDDILQVNFIFVSGINDPKTVNMNTSLADMGLDSLMESEVKNILEYKYSVVISAQEIRRLTFEKLLELQAKNSS